MHQIMAYHANLNIISTLFLNFLANINAGTYQRSYDLGGHPENCKFLKYFDSTLSRPIDTMHTMSWCVPRNVGITSYISDQ